MVGQERYSQQPYIDSAQHTASFFQPPSPHSASVSSLVVKTKDNPLSCDGEETISIQYNFVGEAAGAVDLMYLVSSDWSVLETSRKYTSTQVCMLTVMPTLYKR